MNGPAMVPPAGITPNFSKPGNRIALAIVVSVTSIILSAVALPFVYAVTMIFAKTAILLEWTHLFVPTGIRNSFYWGSRITMVSNILLYAAGLIAESVACIPLATIWEPWLMGECHINKKNLDVTTAYFNLFVDFVILLLPQKVIWNLQMTKSRKVGVSVIFSFGILTVACAAGRVYANHTLTYVDEQGADTNYGLAALYLWGFTELTCVLLVFNIPAVPKLFSEGLNGSRLVSYVRSWTRFSSLKGTSSKVTTASSVWSPGNKHSKAATYRVMDDHSQIQLTKLQTSKGRDYCAPYSNGPAQEDGAIVCQTEFGAHEDVVSRASNASNGGVFARQHPWSQG
ncbi:hypothetical protein DL768_005035 [Monosporascus sp. mg162]|nr:hypothetical protein DL768_005035 [Monosporascus sp. mg162]